MKKLSIRSIILGGGIAVFVPLICFLILRSAGHTGHIAVPKNYGVDTIVEKTIDGKTSMDTIYHSIDSTRFLSHLNKPVNLAIDYPRETMIINFFTTATTPESEKLIYHFERIQQGFKLKKHDTSIQLLSVATMPSIDHIDAVRNYANKHTLDHDTWTFLMADSNELVRFMNKELLLDKANNLTGEAKNQLVLIDKYKNIRGYYNGLDSMDVKRCIDDVALLMVEKNKIHEKKRR